jgi:hypothetical protein
MIRVLYCKNCEYQLDILVPPETTDKQIDDMHFFCCRKCLDECVFH